MFLVQWYLSQIPGFHDLEEGEKRKYRIEISNSIAGAIVGLSTVIVFYLLNYKDLSFIFLLPTITCLINSILSLKKKTINWVPTIGSSSFGIAFILSKLYHPNILVELAFFPILAGLFTNPIKSTHKKVVEIGLIIGFVICILTTWFQAEDIFKMTNGNYRYVDVFLIIGVLSLVALIIVMRNLSTVQNHYERTLIRKNNEILLLESQKHEQALFLKQRDMELLQAENEMKLKVNENIFEGIKTILAVKGDVRSDLKTLFIDLQLQIEKARQINFKHKHLEVINSKFYDKLNDQFPNLTKSEIELCAYLKLQLSAKEIASLKNVSVNGVNVSKNRLRKKMNIDSNKGLNRFLQNL